MTIVFNAKELNLSDIKNKKGLEKLYDNLINFDCDLRCQTTLIDTKHNDRNHTYNVDVEFTRNDCCISSWSYNFYFRTNNAIKAKRYKSFKTMVYNLKRLCKRYDCEIHQLRFYKGMYDRLIFVLNI